MLLEFKKFLMRGNVIDLAVGIIIGAAFGKIVDSLVKDLLMPPLGYLLSGVDFSKMSWVLSDDGKTTVNYGLFLNNIIQFIVIGLAVFLLIKALNKMSLHKEKAPTPTPRQEVLLQEIRDLLVNHKNDSSKNS